MLRVVVYVNKLAVAEARARNISELADLSDYEVRAIEGYAPHMEIAPSDVTGKILKHPRKTSVWHLVRKMCDVALGESKDDSIER